MGIILESAAKSFQTIYYTFLFYGGVLLFPYSPGTLAWKLFKNRKGKVPLFKRDLICDTETLLKLPKSEFSLDEFTTAFSPFIPLLTLNGREWQSRRKILSNALREMNFSKELKWKLPLKKGDIYWDIYEILFNIGFELIFFRSPTSYEYNEMYPGLVDINRMIKRQRGLPDSKARWKLYNQVVSLISTEKESFIFKECDAFHHLSEIDQVSIIVEDILTSICIQCSDLICHMLLLYSNFREPFKVNLDHCINETLRLYPLTDIWTRRGQGNERGWIASLVQLNRNGWTEPDRFKPERWKEEHHPPLISWGFDTRGCPASKIGYHLTKALFQQILSNERLWIQPASNFKHQRTFSDGCQVWTGEGEKPSAALNWKYKGKYNHQIKLWFSGRLRLLDQGELW